MNSLLIIALLLTVILLVPIICRKIHIPTIVGFIVAGVIIGPYTLNWVTQAQEPFLNVIGQIGMLYIMFQAGIEIDQNDFHQNRGKAVLFGIYTFFIPYILGLIGCYLMGMDVYKIFLLAAMYGSHTLMTYPIVTRYGIQKTQVVNIAVGGTMISTLLSLVCLALVKNQVLDVAAPWWYFAGRILLFLVLVLWAFPTLARWVFKRRQDQVVSFMLVMLLLVLSAWLADTAGLDAILGAFLCGVALNGLVPNRSETMRKINFLGTGFFVPIFLITIGMRIDITDLIKTPHTFIIAGLMIGTKIVGKWLAAVVAQWSFHFTRMERQLLFGLTHATAAGTLAIVMIGHRIGVFDTDILNGAVLMILILSTIASFVTEHAAKPIALQEEAKTTADKEQEQWLALSVGTAQDNALQQITLLSDLHQVRQVHATDWTDASNIIHNDSSATLLYCERQPLNTITRIVVVVPPYAEKEYDFISCYGQIRRLSSAIGARVVFYATPDSQRAIDVLAHRKGKYIRASYRTIVNWEETKRIADHLRRDDLIAIISARPSTVSYNPLFTQIPDTIERVYNKHSYILLYPEQNDGGAIQDTLLVEHPQASKTWSILTAIKNKFAKLLHKNE